MKKIKMHTNIKTHKNTANAFQTLNVQDSQELMEKNRIPFARSQWAKNEKELEKVKITFPWVMKVVSNKIVHKTEFNGVRVGINSLKNAREVWKEMKKLPGFNGVLVQEQAGGFELIIGGKRDLQFGPTVLVGLGGIYTEIFRDFSLRICPIAEKDADGMLKELRAFPVLAGARTGKKVNFNKLKTLILNAGKAMEKNSKILELDLNPVFVNAKQAVAVDARIVMNK